MSQFNWQQDAEDHWEETVIYTPEPDKDPRQRRWWLIPIILLALGVAGWLVYQQANQRIAETTTAVTNDVLSSHNLLLQAVYNKDVDLFIALLSGRDAQWTAAQEAMLPSDTILNRPSFGLYATFAREPDLTSTENRLISLDFSPDLLSAELVLSQAYTYTLPDGRPQTTTLQQTAVYRLGSQRWLYAPPEADFWGDTRNYGSRQLVVVYPARDEELAQRLAVDLEQTLNQLCQALDDINCPNTMTVTLLLSTDADTFVNLTDPQNLWGSGLRVVLPTPTLVGLPVDEAGYKALLRGYSTQVATAVISHLVSWECCQGTPFYQALLDYQLSQLNLRSWPVTRADYERVFEEEIPLRRVIPYWLADNLQAVDPADRWLIYTVADFLLQSSNTAFPATVQRSLNGSSDLFRWLNEHVPNQADMSTFSSGDLSSYWFRTAAILSHVSIDPAPVALPDQDLYLVCNTNSPSGRESATLYRYELATGQWSEELTQESLIVVSALPDDSALIIQNFDEAPMGTIIWQDGQSVLTIQHDETPVYSFGHIYPTGQLLAYRIGQPGDNATPQLIDLDQCEDDQCLVEDRPGLLAWSPDGRQTIIADPFNTFFSSIAINGRRFLFNNNVVDQEPITLYRTSGSERTPIGAGYEPFWIDNETYGYLRPTGEGNLEIVVANTADDTLQTVTSSDFLSSLLYTGGTLAATFNINYVLVDPHDSERLFVVASSGGFSGSRSSYIFSIKWQSNRFSLLLSDNYVGVHTLDISPDGRWLISSSWDETIAGDPISLSGIRLYDLEQHRSQSFITIFPAYFPGYLHDWSADGQWLAVLAGSDKIALTLPGTDYYQIIQHDHGYCISVNWINPINN
jgi:hypothetical protein